MLMTQLVVSNVKIIFSIHMKVQKWCFKTALLVTISFISSWMSSNCLTLNPSKLNFFWLASLNKHPKLSTLRSLYPMHNLSHPLPMLKISVSSSTQPFPFLSRSSLFQVPVTTIYVIFGASATLYTTVLPPPLPPLLLFHDSTTAIPFITNCQPPK